MFTNDWYNIDYFRLLDADNATFRFEVEGTFTLKGLESFLAEMKALANADRKRT